MHGRNINRIVIILRNTTRRFSNRLANGLSCVSSTDESLVFDRLTHAYKALSNSKKSFRHSSYETLKLYDDQESSLFEDIFKYPMINRDLLDLICKNYWKSSSLRSLVLLNLYKISMKHKSELLNEILRFLESKSILGSIETNYGFTHDEGILRVVSLACATGESLIASLILLQLVNQQIKIPEKLVHLTLDCLICYKGPLQPHYIYSALKLLDTFCSIDFRPTVLFKILRFALLHRGLPFYANLVYRKMMKIAGKQDQEINPEDMNDVINTLQELLSRNLEFSMHDEVYTIWKEQFWRFPSLAQDTDLLEHMLTSMPRSYANEIVTTLNPNENARHLEVLIKFYSLDGENSRLKSLMKLVKTPISRQMLSLLLKIQMNEDNVKDSEKVLAAIFGTKNGLSDLDLDTIVCSSLRKGNYRQVVNLMSGVEPVVARKAAVSVIEYFFQSNLSGQRADLIDSAVSLLRDYNDLTSNSRLVVSVIHFLIQRQGPRYAISFLISLNRNEMEDVQKSNRPMISLQHNGVSPRICDILSSKLFPDPVGILLILRVAMEERDAETLKLCISELQDFGFTFYSILSSCKRANSKSFEELFCDKVKGLIN